MASYEQNDIVQAKLSGQYGTATIEIPYELYEKFIDSAVRTLSYAGLKLEEADLIEDARLVKYFEKSLMQMIEAQINNIQYGHDYDIRKLFRNEIDAAEAAKTKELERIVNGMNQCGLSIPVNQGDYEKALAILKAAGMVNPDFLKMKDQLNPYDGPCEDSCVGANNVTIPISITRS